MHCVPRGSVRADPTASAARSAPRPLRLALVLGLAAGLLTACGGGGGAPPPDTGKPVIDGLAGRVLMPNQDLGLIVEQEPNNSVGQAFRLPPVFLRSTLEVAGELGTTDAAYGRADPLDALRYVSLRAQPVSLRVTFAEDDVLGVGTNALSVTVFETATGAAVAGDESATSPVLVDFEAAANRAYDVVLTMTQGHGPYLVRFEPGSGAVSPKPAAGSAADVGPVVVASRRPDAPVRALGYASEEPACSGRHVLVRLGPECDVDAFCQRNGVEVIGRTGSGALKVCFPTPEGESPARHALDRCCALCADEAVLHAEPDWIIRALAEPSDPLFNRQWNMRAVGAPSAWDITRGRSSVVIGVVDTGIIGHPDLRQRTVPGYDFISDPEIAGDGDGRDTDPTDNGDQLSLSGRSTWHGAHVAAIAVGQQGNGGITGVAPNCRVMPLRVIGRGGGLVSDAADAILFAAGLLAPPGREALSAPLPILNLSLGLDQPSAELEQACARAHNVGVFLVGASGNEGGPVFYPAAYDSVFAVAAVDGALRAPEYSNFGPQIELAAPGGLLGRDRWNDGWPDGVLSVTYDDTVAPPVASFRYLTGTSQAAPHVAGAAALMLSLDPGLSAAEIASILRGTARDLQGDGRDNAIGYGLLQVHEALKRVASDMGNPRTDDPRMMLATNSVTFEGFDEFLEVPIFNAGGGMLLLNEVEVRTDDGADWLSASLVPPATAGGPTNQVAVRIQLDRRNVPSTPGRYTGSVVPALVGTPLASIRVVMMVSDRTRAGRNLGVACIQVDNGIARAKSLARPEFGYRYWMRGIPGARYVLMGGEDLDGDGFFCEDGDSCAYFGGATRQDATPVPFTPGAQARTGLDLFLRPPP